MSELSHYGKEAVAALRESEVRLYLGARYGLTPNTFISPEMAREFLASNPGSVHYQPLCQIASRLENTVGRAKLTQTFADRYSDLENVRPETQEELVLLSPITKGKVVVTGTYSSTRFAHFEQVLLAVEDSGVKNIRPRHRSSNTYLVMLHGEQTNPGGVLLSKLEVDGFEGNRPDLSALVRSLLEELPWVVLGFDQGADETFFRLCWKVSQKLRLPQRPIYVVDPREFEVVAPEWPRDPFRHVRMRPLEFLRAFRHGNGDEPSSSAGDPPPISPSETPDESVQGNSEEDRARPRPTDVIGAKDPRQIEVEWIDGGLFRTTAPGSMLVSTFAGQFVRRHVHGDRSGSRPDRAVVELERDGDAQRLNGDQTIHEAGVRDGDRVRIHNEAVAGANPQKLEALLTAVQTELEELAARDDRITVRPNLPGSADRYEITLRCGGWGPPESPANKPYRTFEQDILLEYPAEFPDVPLLVMWRSPIFHPNVRSVDGFVCLGALQERYTPLFRPRDLVFMLIELSEYRNYELDGVLNREAAIWAQLRSELIVEYGGWPYQPTLEEDLDDDEPTLEFEDCGTGVGLRRRRKP